MRNLSANMCESTDNARWHGALCRRPGRCRTGATISALLPLSCSCVPSSRSTWLLSPLPGQHSSIPPLAAFQHLILPGPCAASHGSGCVQQGQPAAAAGQQARCVEARGSGGDAERRALVPGIPRRPRQEACNACMSLMRLQTVGLTKGPSGSAAKRRRRRANLPRPAAACPLHAPIMPPSCLQTAAAWSSPCPACCAA